MGRVVIYSVDDKVQLGDEQRGGFGRQSEAGNERILCWKYELGPMNFH